MSMEYSQDYFIPGDDAFLQEHQENTEQEQEKQELIRKLEKKIYDSMHDVATIEKIFQREGIQLVVSWGAAMLLELFRQSKDHSLNEFSYEFLIVLDELFDEVNDIDFSYPVLPPEATTADRLIYLAKMEEVVERLHNLILPSDAQLIVVTRNPSLVPHNNSNTKPLHSAGYWKIICVPSESETDKQGNKILKILEYEIFGPVYAKDQDWRNELPMDGVCNGKSINPKNKISIVSVSNGEGKNVEIPALFGEGTLKRYELEEQYAVNEVNEYLRKLKYPQIKTEEAVINILDELKSLGYKNSELRQYRERNVRDQLISLVGRIAHLGRKFSDELKEIGSYEENGNPDQLENNIWNRKSRLKFFNRFTEEYKNHFSNFFPLHLDGVPLQVLWTFQPLAFFYGLLFEQDPPITAEKLGICLDYFVKMDKVFQKYQLKKELIQMISNNSFVDQGKAKPK